MKVVVAVEVVMAMLANNQHRNKITINWRLQCWQWKSVMALLAHDQQ